jgi:hypothetical protein
MLSLSASLSTTFRMSAGLLTCVILIIPHP